MMKKKLAKRAHSSMDTLAMFSGCDYNCSCSCGGGSGYSVSEDPIEQNYYWEHIDPQVG